MNTADRVLAILAREKEYVSGEDISSRIGLSRAAVNAAVKALRSAGYEIDSVTNKGYRLLSAPDVLNLGLLGAYISDERLESLTVLNSTDSTNKVLREMAFDGAPAGQTVIANEQSAGRGRMGRNFFSPRDNGIYLSYLLRPDVAPAEAVTLTAWTAAAMVRAVKKVAGTAPGIKWVNDLYMNGKKICGILTEMSVESETGRIDSIIIGIGINVNTAKDDFPEDIRDIASSIAAETGNRVSRTALAAAMIGELDKLNADWPKKKDDYLEAYRQYDMTCGRDINVISRGSVRPAEAITINDDFSLKVKYPGGETEDLSSGEVSLKLV